MVIDPADEHAAERLEDVRRLDGPVYWYDGVLSQMKSKEGEASERAPYDAYLRRAAELNGDVEAMGWTGPIEQADVTFDVEDKLSMLRLRDPTGHGKVRIWCRGADGKGAP
jgi:hypothetical protein